MTLLPLVSAFLLAAQTGANAPAQSEITDFAQLPVEEATAPRCSVAFAIIQGAQKEGDERAKQWPDLVNAKAREFFVVSMARLMDDRKLDREQIAQLVERETGRLQADNDKTANEMMPACLLLLDAAQL